MEGPMMSFRVEGKRMNTSVFTFVSDTVLDLKEKIDEFLDVDAARQTLEFNDQVLDDEKQLKDYPIQGHPVFKLTVRPLEDYPVFPVKIISATREDYKETAMMVFELDKVVDLKRKISVKWQVPPEEFILRRIGREMYDDDTLLDYHVRENCYIHFVAN